MIEGAGDGDDIDSDSNNSDSNMNSDGYDSDRDSGEGAQRSPSLARRIRSTSGVISQAESGCVYHGRQS